MNWRQIRRLPGVGAWRKVTAMRFPLLFLLVLCSAPTTNSLGRAWTQAATGKTLEADFVRVVDQKVELKLKTGKTYQVPIATLSVDDQAHIQELMAAGTKEGVDWPKFRGAKQDGISPEVGVLREWPAGGPKLLWTYDEAGAGYTSCSIVGGVLFTLGTRGDKLMAMALNAEKGAELWTSELGVDDQEAYMAGWGQGPRGTPTYDDGKLYILGPKGDLYCVDAKGGKVLWSQDLRKDYSGEGGKWGYSESPLVDENRVVVAPGGDKASIVALDKNSGMPLWQSGIKGAGQAEYATIVAAELDGRPQYVKLFQQLLVGVNPSDGQLLWQSDWPGGRTAVIPTPIVEGSHVYITSGYGAGSKLVEVEGGKATDVWSSKEMKNHHGGVIKIGDYLYGFSDGAGLICQSWKTGDLVWNEKGEQGELQKGSVHAVDGLLICVNERDGMVSLVEANPEKFVKKGQFKLEPQSRIRSPKGMIWTHPLVLNGKLYLRDQEYIHCYDVKG